MSDLRSIKRWIIMLFIFNVLLIGIFIGEKFATPAYAQNQEQQDGRFELLHYTLWGNSYFVLFDTVTGDYWKMGVGSSGSGDWLRYGPNNIKAKQIYNYPEKIKYIDIPEETSEN